MYEYEASSYLEDLQYEIDCEMDDAQQLVARIYPNQDSGVLSSAVWAQGFVEIAEGRTLKSGDKVDYFSFEQILA